MTDPMIIVDDGDGIIVAEIDKSRTAEYGPTIYKKKEYYHDIKTALRDEFDIKVAEPEEE